MGYGDNFACTHPYSYFIFNCSSSCFICFLYSFFMSIHSFHPHISTSYKSMLLIMLLNWNIFFLILFLNLWSPMLYTCSSISNIFFYIYTVSIVFWKWHSKYFVSTTCSCCCSVQQIFSLFPASFSKFNEFLYTQISSAYFSFLLLFRAR